MLSITKIKNSSKTTQYFAKDDYYSGNDSSHLKYSFWHGQGSQELKLDEHVDSKIFQAILEGKLPNGKIIGVMKGGELIHDAGRDLTFSAPKSVSIMALVFEDNKLIEAHNQAVKDTLDEIEKNFLKVRVKKANKIFIEDCQKSISAVFKHELSRDLDPQLHSHVVMANIVKDKNNNWRSAYFDEIYNNKKIIGAIYRSYLAKSIKQIGYEIEHKGQNCYFEIKGIPPEIIDLFSSRSKKIRQIANANSSQKELEKITLKSRNNKVVSEYNHNLKPQWQDKIALLNLNFNDKKILNNREIFTTSSQNKELLSNQAVEYAIKHLSERKTIFSRGEIINHALNDTLSNASLEDIVKVIDHNILNKNLLIKQRDDLPINTYTTKDLLAKENEIITILNITKNKFSPIIKNIKEVQNNLINLNDGQKQSAELILQNQDMITGIQGFAGVGKTFMLDVVNKITQSRGYEMIGLSPTGIATRNLNSSANINSMTLQRFLSQYDGVAMGRGTKRGRLEMQELFKNKIVVVDESSMISTNQMRNLLKIASELNFRLVLIGDRRQLDSVEAGVPFYEMQRNQMAFVDMKTIIRQKNPDLKNAVYATIKRDIDKAFNAISHDIFQSENVTEMAVKKFMELSNEERKQTIILAPANQSRDEINGLVSNLIYQERLDKSAINSAEFDILKNKKLTEAEKSRAYRFQKGDIILFAKNRDYIGIKKNDYCEVVNIDIKNNLLTILNKKNQELQFDPNKLRGKASKNYFEVFNNEKRIFHEGDKICFNRNIPNLNIINSDNGIIKKINRSNIVVEIEGKDSLIEIKKKSFEAKHLDFSYALTTHKAQGLTTENVIAICESKHQKLTSQKNFYVEISRAKERAIIIADDKEKIIKILKENTGIEISAREHQNIANQGINQINISKNTEIITKNKSFINKDNYTKNNKILNHYEIKNYFAEAIKSNIKIESNDLENSIAKALNNVGKKIRFGKKSEYELCWRGEAGYIKNYKTDEFFKWGLNSIKNNQNLFIKNDKISIKENSSTLDNQSSLTANEVALQAKKYFEKFNKSDFLNIMQNQYLQKKSINQKMIDGIKFTNDNKIVIPLFNIKGEIQTLQFIDQNGKKSFLKGGKKQGNFFIIDDKKIKDSSTIFLAEGFATAVSIHLATNKPVAVAFDAGNIEHVLKNLKSIFADKDFIITADNDLYSEKNIGLHKANLAGQKYGAKVLIPNFHNLNLLPNDLNPQHLKPTDFNDLHQIAGLEIVKNQIHNSTQMIVRHHEFEMS